MPQQARGALSALLARLLVEYATGAAPNPGVMSMSADKICARHLVRKAVLFVRQSSAHQVLHNREGQALQYAMRERLLRLGWSDVEVLDEDLGCAFWSIVNTDSV